MNGAGRASALGASQNPKAEFLWVSPPPPLLSPSASVKSAFASFQGFLEADRAGRSTMGDFKIHKYYAVSSWFGSHTKAGGASQNVNSDHNIGR